MDSGVLSQTPGNFFAEKTVKTSLKHEASTGDLPVLTTGPSPLPFGGGPTLTNENLSLKRGQVSPTRLAQWFCPRGVKKQNIPEVALGSDTEILEYKPNADFVIGVY